MPRKEPSQEQDRDSTGEDEGEDDSEAEQSQQRYEEAWFRFYRRAGDDNLITPADDTRLPDRGPTAPPRARVALDEIIELHRRGAIITDRAEIKDRVSRRKQVPETGSQDLFDTLLSYSVLVPVRRVTGGADDRYLIHGDVVGWFDNVLNQDANLMTESCRLEAIMRFLTSERVLDSERSPRELAQDAWLYGRMTGPVETDAADSRLTHEGKLKATEKPAEEFLLADAYVPESDWGNLYNQYILQGWLAAEVEPISKRVYEEDMEQHLRTILTAALYETGAFQALRERLGADDSESGTDDEDPEELVRNPEDVSLAEFRRALVGLSKNSDLSTVSERLPDKALEFDTAFGPEQTRTAAYYVIRNNEVSR